MRRLSVVLLALILLLVTVPLLAQSQATTGVIEGTVVDASAAAVPGVTLTVKNTATGYETVVVTDSAGRFRAVLLPLGPYQVTAVLQGFATVVQKGLDLGVGQTLTVTITLKQATAAEEIVVTAAPPLIETARTENPQLELLGILISIYNGRDAVQAAMLSRLQHAGPVSDRAFTDLGLDSLGAVQLRNRVNAATGLAVPVTVVFDHPTSRAVASYLSLQMGPSATAEPGAGDERADGHDPADAVDDMDAEALAKLVSATHDLELES